MTRPGRLPCSPDPESVLLAMSGGVDSSVAALLLQGLGMRVVGVTFLLDPDGNSPAGLPSDPSCPRFRASEVCARLGISHEVVDLREAFETAVIGPCCRAYAGGLTPNPCVVCNPQVKWSSLLALADRWGCRYVATGHYARIDEAEARFRLLRGLDRDKDQSYALYRLSQQALGRTLLPLGSLRKTAVRSLAAEASLPAREIPESQDLCFVPRKGWRAFLEARLPVAPGPVLDTRGRCVGSHAGLPFYTVGQRKGLGLPMGKPVYVIEKRAADNTLVVGPREALSRGSFVVRDVNWCSTPPPAPMTTLTVEVEVRYRTRCLPAEVLVLDAGTVRVELQPHPQALAPGQSAVWYQSDVLLGGGFIET